MKRFSRRELISNLTTVVQRKNAERIARAGYLRPPRAIDEVEFLLTCDGCQACVEACPYGSIYILQTEDLADGTPVLSPAERPCHMCVDFPCVQACPSGALSMAQELLSLGGVRILEKHCLPFRGPECGACNVCPEGVNAMKFHRNKPAVDLEKCIGCGLCIEACPTTPKALVFLELSDLLAEE